MFREMRLKNQILPENDTLDVIKNNKTGTLSVLGDDGYPYGVPLNFAYDDGKLYFHCAKKGHKVDAIKKENKVCFTIIDKDEVLPAEFNTLYKSVIIFGKANILTDEDAMRKGLRVILNKYSPDFLESGEKYIDEMFKAVCVFEVDIDKMTGKMAEELF